MVAAAVTGDVLVMCVGADAVWVRHDTGTVRVPALAAPLAGDWVYGEPAVAAGTAGSGSHVFDHAVDDVRLQTGLLRYVAAVAGAAPDIGTVLVVHPTGWSARRREALCTAARHVARNAELMPVAVAARHAVAVADGERCVVLEVTAGGATATASDVGPDGAFVAARIARAPHLTGREAGADGGAAAVDALVRSVSGAVDPDVVIVTGIPGEPSGVDLCGRLRDRIGRGIRVVPVAAGEILDAIEAQHGGQGAADAAERPVTGSTARWLRDVRDPMPDPPRSTRAARWIPAVAGGVAVIAAVAWFAGVVAAPVGDGILPEAVAGTDVAMPEAEAEADAAPSGSGRRGPAPSVTVELGAVNLDLPAQWRIRDAESVGTGRVELLPASGTDRRIVVVDSRLADGVGVEEVATTLAERIAHRGAVIRDFDPDATVGGRPVIAYTEVPDDYSIVRWSVIVEDGIQVAVGCQYLVDEWSGIRNDCEQAVHTLVVP